MANKPVAKEDKEVTAARKDAEKKAAAAGDAAAAASEAQADAAEAQESAEIARAEAEAAKAEVVATKQAAVAEATAPQPVVAGFAPSHDDYAEYTIMHNMVGMPDGEIKHKGDQVTSKELRGEGSKTEQDAREQRYIEAGAVVKTGEVKFRPI